MYIFLVGNNRVNSLIIFPGVKPDIAEVYPNRNLEKIFTNCIILISPGANFNGGVYVCVLVRVKSSPDREAGT